MRLLFALLLVLATPAHSETLNTLTDPYGHCDQQSLEIVL